MRSSNLLKSISKPVLPAVLAAQSILAQAPNSASTGSDSGTFWYFAIGVAAVIGAGAFVAIRMKMKEEAGARKRIPRNAIIYDWKPDFSAEAGPAGAGFSRSETRSKKCNKKMTASEASLHGIDIDEVREKMERIKFERLPINRLEKLEPPKAFEALPESDADELLDAVEESDVEFTQNEETRERALETLSKHKVRNSVDALSQMALYDVSSNLRSKAVMALADFNHPSVFETVMLTCADPSREVRAAGARAMFKLNFKRADAWLRTADCGDQYRVSQVARAALEANFVGRSLERLVHSDVDYAYEALALIALLVKAGETDDIFDYLATGEDRNVRYAILCAFQIIGDSGVAPRLEEFVEADLLDEDLALQAKETLESFAAVSA